MEFNIKNSEHNKPTIESHQEQGEKSNGKIKRPSDMGTPPIIAERVSDLHNKTENQDREKIQRPPEMGTPPIILERMRDFPSAEDMQGKAEKLPETESPPMGEMPPLNGNDLACKDGLPETSNLQTNEKRQNSNLDSGRDNNETNEANKNQTDNKDGTEKSFSRQETVDGKTYYYDDNGNLYRVDNDLSPNTTYEINGYKYTTDDKGRIISAEGTLHLKEREGRLSIRDSLKDIGKGDEKEGDNRGHLIGDQFDGTNGLENMIPQDANINKNDFKNFENDLAKAVKDGKKVTVKIEPIYEGDSRRPSAIIVTYTIDGKESVRVFPNESEG